MNSKFKKFMISILLLVVGFGYLYYVVTKTMDKKQEEQELQQIEEEAKKIEEEEKTNEISLEKNEEVEVKKINPAEKIQELRDRNSKYAYFKVSDIGNFYFEEESNNLGLYFLNKKIGTFNKVSKNKLGIKKIYGNLNYIFITIGNENFLCSLKTKTIKTINLELEVEYIKKGINNLEFLFKTPVGIFIYTTGNNSLEYFVFFEDFLYYNNGYLGIVRKDEDIKLNNLGFEEEKQNLIIYYNPITKEKSIIYRTDLDLKKIYYKGVKVYFEDSEGEEYELKNETISDTI